MIGRGGGKKMSNRSIIAPGRLQNIIRSSRNNHCNTHDDGIVFEKGKL